ncbi:MAG: ribonuclease H-like domain-containing protein [Anaerolineales bacterium]|nr:ribonuclease H-like domain-containing protein [Anaerolineales bacterium]
MSKLELVIITGKYMDSAAKKPSLADKLKSLGVKLGTVDIPASQHKAGAPIQDVLAGRFVSTRRGEAFIYEEIYGTDYRHGLAPLETEAPLNLLAAWANDSRLLDIPLEGFAFLDTETSGMAGGTGTYAFLVGVGRFEPSASGRTLRQAQGRHFRLLQFFMRDPSEEPALLEALAEFLAPCSALVTYNGKAFDAPLLVTRYTLHDIPVPFKDYAHVDLLHLARRLWRDRLPSRTLKYIEENVLDAPRTSAEVPGYEIPWLYFDYLRTGDANEMKGVFYHNAMDIVALAALFSHTAAMLHDPFDERIQHGLDVVALAKLHEDLDRQEIAARLYERGLEMPLDEEDFWKAVRRLAVLQKRRGDLEGAVRWWEQAATQGHVYAHIELAKHYEHRRRDYPEARKWVQEALSIVDSDEAMPTYVREHWQAELQHRLERLEGKLKSRPVKGKKHV